MLTETQCFEIFLRNVIDSTTLDDLSKEYHISLDEVQRGWHHAGYRYKIQINRWRNIKHTTRQHLGLPDSSIAKLLELTDAEFAAVDSVSRSIEMDRQGVGEKNKSNNWKPRPHKLRRRGDS